MTPQLQKEHQLLQKLVGEWTSEGECVMEPGKPPTKMTGTESVRSVGGLWIVAEGSGEMPGGGPSTTIMTLGYDPQKKRFVGTFIGSMMTNMWVYDGSLDTSGNVLTLDTEGPQMGADGQMHEGKLTKYKDIVEFKNDNERVLRSEMLGSDGKWTQIVSVTYRRKK
jgi:hypothetical protein